MASVSRSGEPYIAVRVGRSLSYIEDRAALECYLRAWRQAEDIGRSVFPTEDAFTDAETQARRAFERRRNGG